MPSVSQPQHNAMEAAAHGKSKLGIPKKVGKEYSEADTRAKVAALRKKPKHAQHQEPDGDEYGAGDQSGVY